MQELQILLDKAGIIREKYELLDKSKDFNIFSILRNIHEEVGLHSRFIAELLNPQGSHRQSSLFLGLFLKLLEDFDFDAQSVKVEREWNNIDIFIYNQNREAIIIENKIWAGDQDKQLRRYNDLTIDKGFTVKAILYLTLDGHEPSKESLGELELNSITLISYQEHIRAWIDLCVKEVALLPPLREALSQYKNIVNQITGNTMNEEEKNKLVELLSMPDNIESAHKIASSWIEVTVQAELKFWEKLEEMFISDNYKIPRYRNFDHDKIRKHHRDSRGRPAYGICLSLERTYGEYDVYWFICKGFNNEIEGYLQFSKEVELTNVKNTEQVNFPPEKIQKTKINVDFLTPNGIKEWEKSAVDCYNQNKAIMDDLKAKYSTSYE